MGVKRIRAVVQFVRIAETIIIIIRIALVADAVEIRVQLIRIRLGRAVVASITDAIAIGVQLRGIE